jgi:hypothetical protein
MSGNTSLKHTAKELWGSASICAIADLPCHLEYLSEMIPGGEVIADKIIESHTTAPYFTSFLLGYQAKDIYTAMKSSKGHSVHALIGTRHTDVKNPRWLRYCTQCVELQKSIYGIPYWRRVHQLPGVYVCPDHRVLLKDSKIEFSRKNNQRLYELLRLNESDRDAAQFAISSEINGHLLFIAEESSWLLQNKKSLERIEQLKEFYTDKLKEKGFVTLSGRIRMLELAEQFNEFYGQEFLRILGCWVDKKAHSAWLNSIFRSTHIFCHPLRHILLCRFLQTTVEDLLDLNFVADSGPFGYGPWPCLNKACEYYHMDVIRKVALTRNKKSKETIGTFECTCGYSYTRQAQRSSDKFKYDGRVKHVGSKWLAKFEEIRVEGRTIREMAHDLGVSTTVIQRYLQN